MRATTILVLKCCLMLSVLATCCSGDSFEEVSNRIAMLFKVFKHEQYKIMEEIKGIKNDVTGIDETSGSCGGKLDGLKLAIEGLDETVLDYCMESSEVLKSFEEVLRQDECTSGTHHCHRDAVCTDLLIGFKCSCPEGFTGDGKSCQDVNECAQRTHNCHGHASCTNLNGHYKCKCNSGYDGDGVVCTEKKRCGRDRDCPATFKCEDIGLANNYCFCKDGYHGNGISCTDVDECQDGRHNCHDMATCTNVPGMYSCTCKSGFKGSGYSCEDVDECQGIHSCHPDASCNNNIGSYECSCNPGFLGDGQSCEDVDECEGGLAKCKPKSSCNNIPGNYSCICNPGFQEGDGNTCEDLNECLGQHDCHAVASCNNIEGSYACSCNVGYEGNGYQCEDLCPFERVPEIGCLFFDLEVIKTWTEAGESCTEVGGHLFSASSPETFSLLQQFLVEKAPFEIPDWSGLWVGIQGDRWMGGRLVSSQEWTNAICPTSGECCGSLLSGPTDYSLNKDPCEWPRYSICQLNETSF